MKKRDEKRKRSGAKKRMMRVLVGLIVAGALAEGVLLAAIVYMENIEHPIRDADAIIVLGAMVRPDGALSTVLERRVEVAHEAYQQGRAERVIVCGAQGKNEPSTEARAMAEALIERGVPAQAILLEEDSFNTAQNLTNARRIMQDEGLDSALVVTNDYHMARALSICGELGMDASGLPAASADTAFVRWRLRVRESLSWVNYILRQKILGDYL